MSNVNWFIEQLTTDAITKKSQGKIQPMSLEAAAGLVGGWMVETGDPNLINLDVVEKGAEAGRGLSQWTDARRVPYDRARAEALRYGQDPNSREWQFQYVIDEYLGKYDQNGLSNIGWTKSFGDNLPASGSPSDYARYFTDNYFRPSEPHVERRMRDAETVFQGYTPPKPRPTFGPAKRINSTPQGRNWQNPYGQVSDKPSEGNFR